MRTTFCSHNAAICFAFSAIAFACAANCPAEEPKLEELVAASPALSSEGDDLKGFAFSGSVQMSEQVLIQFRYAWEAPDRFASLLTLDGGVSTPILFCSQNQLMLVDYLTGNANYYERATPQFILKRDEDSAKFNLGISLKGAGKIDFDPASFLHPDALGDKAKWERRSESKWRYVNVSNTGRSNVTADFDLRAKYPLQSLTARDAEDDSLIWRVENISVNEPIPARLSNFPRREQFPDGMSVTSTKFEDANKEGLALISKVLNAYLATTAIDVEEVREFVELVGKVDWKQAKKNRDRFAPALSRMFDELAKQPAAAP